MPDFARLLLAALLGAGLALGGQNLLQPKSAQTAAVDAGALVSADADGVGSTSVDLSERVSDLRFTQQRLQSELAALRQQLAETSVADVQEPVAALASTPAVRPSNAALTIERLTESGINQSEAELLVQRLDELALARLEADYRVRQAAGDRELNLTAREERRGIPRDAAAIRDEFGDIAYDSYLYASNQPNRVEVASVLRSSAAVTAGVQSGDLLRSLDGKPLYSVRDLTTRVREGSPGQEYALSVERDGQVIEVWVPGGPLGVRVTGKSVAPEG